MQKASANACDGIEVRHWDRAGLEGHKTQPGDWASGKGQSLLNSLNRRVCKGSAQRRNRAISLWTWFCSGAGEKTGTIRLQLHGVVELQLGGSM